MYLYLQRIDENIKVMNNYKFIVGFEQPLLLALQHSQVER